MANAVLGNQSHDSEGDTVSEFVEIAVTDTGHGITEVVAAKAIEPFFTTKGVGKGSGLGLSMVYGFVKQSKGHINIESAVDIGTVVRLYLPQTGQGGKNFQLTSNHEHQLILGSTVGPIVGKIVLVVEDDADICALTVSMLG